MLTLLLAVTSSLAAPTFLDPAITATQVVDTVNNNVGWSSVSEGAIGPDGRFYITAGPAVHVWDETLGTVEEFATLGGTLFEIAWTADGTAWVSDYGGVVYAVDPSGALLGTVSVTYGLVGLTVDADDRIYTSTHLDGRVFEIDPLTMTSTLDGLLPYDPQYTRAGCVRTWDLSTDPSGHVTINDLGCDEWTLRRVDDADLLPVDLRYEVIFDAPVPYGFYHTAWEPDGSAWLTTYPNELWRREPGGLIDLVATGLDSNGGSSVFWDASRSLLFITDRSGVWRVGEPGPTISWSGTCPGPMTLTLTGFTPSSSITVVSAPQAGSAVVPAGPCAGAVSSLGAPGIRIRATPTADASGNATLQVNMPAAACGQANVQALDVETCTFSNVDIP